MSTSINTKAERWFLRKTDQLGIEVFDGLERLPGGEERRQRWDGKSLMVRSTGGPVWLWLLHEVNHWRLAPPRRRSMPNYGLGNLDDDPHTDRMVDYSVAEFEERCVATLDAAVMFQLGAPAARTARWWVDVWAHTWSLAWIDGRTRLVPHVRRGLAQYAQARRRVLRHATDEERAGLERFERELLLTSTDPGYPLELLRGSGKAG